MVVDLNQGIAVRLQHNNGPYSVIKRWRGKVYVFATFDFSPRSGLWGVSNRDADAMIEKEPWKYALSINTVTRFELRCSDLVESKHKPEKAKPDFFHNGPKTIQEMLDAMNWKY